MTAYISRMETLDVESQPACYLECVASRIAGCSRGPNWPITLFVATVAEMNEPSRTAKLTREHVLLSWSAQAQTKPLVVTGGHGSHFTTEDSREILDFSSQLICSKC